MLTTGEKSLTAQSQEVLSPVVSDKPDAFGKIQNAKSVKNCTEHRKDGNYYHSGISCAYAPQQSAAPR